MICAALAMACSSQSQNIKAVAVAQVPAAAGTPTAAAAANAPAAGDVDPALVKEGYRVVRRQGKVLYCQTQTVTGTKFGSTTCATAEQIHESERETELSRQQLIRSGPAYCVGTQCAK
jgi:3-oxoacyl-ACP reductase-like protein